MKTTVPTLLLTVAACLLVGVHRMPAPITVPPEATPQPSIMPNAESPPAKQAGKKVEKEKKAVPPKPSPPKKSGSLAGVWVGRWYAAPQDRSAPSSWDTDQKTNYVFEISADETTIRSSSGPLPGALEIPRPKFKFKRNGNIITWLKPEPLGTRPDAPPKTGDAEYMHHKITLKTDGSARWDCVAYAYKDGQASQWNPIHFWAELHRQ